MSAKHTTGPWKCYPSIESDGHYQVFDLAGNFLTINDEVHEANARLIAAAPELLDALKDMVGIYDYADFAHGVEHNGMDEGNVIAGRVIEKARAAIAKAKGEPTE